MNNDSSPRQLTRRNILGGIGMSLLVAPLSQVIACDSDGDDEAEGSNGTAKWATGGTAAMTAASTYPDPFASGPGTTCKLTCEQILGPCHASKINRKDISEGQRGLPVRLAFLVLDESCKPVQDAEVDIWHAGPSGNYSDGDSDPFCHHDDPEAVAARWFRGAQATDAKGRVDFDTCFPGWYVSRAVHIHFTVRIGGTDYVTSQFYFDDALNDEILTSQPLYNTRGERDTRNTVDMVIDPDHLADFTLQTERMSDGALLVWKAIVVRSSTGTELCEANSKTIEDLGNSGVDPNDPSTFPDQPPQP